jgi:hypothetical protein
MWCTTIAKYEVCIGTDISRYFPTLPAPTMSTVSRSLRWHITHTLGGAVGKGGGCGGFPGAAAFAPAPGGDLVLAEEPLCWPVEEEKEEEEEDCITILVATCSAGNDSVTIQNSRFSQLTPWYRHPAIQRSSVCKVLQSTVSLANSQHVMLLMADRRAPMAHGTCSYQTSGIPIYTSPNNF